MTDAAAIRVRPASTALTDWMLAILVGGTAFLVIVGYQVLDVTNILWLTTGTDSFQHYLGWEFFRHSPWSWPPGLNPEFGLQFSSSIIFSDSVPLLAIPLKLLAQVLPEPFQYTGFWVLLCFLLQAYFGTRLVGLFSHDTLLKLGFATLVVFSPPMLWRLSVHFSLVCHWIVLASIFLFFAPTDRWRGLAWAALLSATALVHTYVLAMCSLIWVASWFRRDPAHAASIRYLAAEIVGVCAGVFAVLWLGGFFPLRSSMLASGYGFYRMNVLAPINPEGGLRLESWPWSSLLPTLPHALGDYEGFNYLGVGGLAAIVFALPLLWTERAAYTKQRLWPLLVAAILLLLFALSPNLTIGNRAIEIPVPESVFTLASSMRSSGRFFWPIFYLLLLAAAWLLHRAIGGRAAGVLFVVIAALQIYDTHPGWSALRAKFEVAGSTYSTTIDDPRLSAIATHYKAVRALPAANQLPKWEQTAYFALRNRLPTDSAYLARPDDAGYAAYAAGIDDTIARHGLDPQALYFLDDDFARRVAAAMTASDEMFHVGDFYVFAPGWHALGGSTDIPPARP